MAETTRTTSQAPERATTDASAVLELLAGGYVAQVLHAVAALHIADHLADEPRTAEDVADRAGSHTRATYRLMRAAASLGVLSYEGDGRFGLTGRGQLLRDGVAGSMRSYVLVQTGHAHWQSWGLFPDAVRHGASQTTKALGTDIFDYYGRAENAAEATLFSQGMGDLSAMVSQGTVAAVDTTGVDTAVDVGGADGHLVMALMAADPNLSGQVVDLPHVVPDAVRKAEALGMTDRLVVTAGDFFTAVPPADLYLLKTVLHDWNDDQCTTILRNCRAGIRAGGRALIVETVIGELGKPDYATLSDMLMLTMTHGMERDLHEFDALFAASGWRRTKTFPVGGGYHGIELVAA